jgi:hypothetical protein
VPSYVGACTSEQTTGACVNGEVFDLVTPLEGVPHVPLPSVITVTYDHSGAHGIDHTSEG